MSSRGSLGTGLVPALLAPVLLAASAAGTPSASPSATVPTALTAFVQDVAADFDADLERYSAALAVWTERYDATEDRKEQRRLKKEHPAEFFGPAMRAHFIAGDLRAARWCQDNLRNLGLRSSERKQLQADLHRALVFAADDELRRESLALACKDSSFAREVGLAELEVLVRGSLELEPVAEERGHGLMLLADRYLASREDAEAEQGKALLRALLEPAAPEAGEDGPWATLSADDRERAERILFGIENLAVGAAAPDFTGASVDGDELSMAELASGKVTVLQFFGFW